MTLEGARQWSASCREIYGIATRVVRDPQTRTWTAEHDPDECCGQEAHDPYTRDGACRVHEPFGASEFCLACRPKIRCSEAARKAAAAARKAASQWCA
jgi:hypothetical protein